jgi:hypothetical protein
VRRDLTFFCAVPLVIVLTMIALVVNGGTIYPANSSFEDDDASAGGPLPGVLEGLQYPNSWEFYCPRDINGNYDQFVDIVNDPIAAPSLGTSYTGLTGSQYLHMYGFQVSPQVTQILADTVRAGKKYELLADFAGGVPGNVNSVTLTLSANGPVTYPALSVPNDYTSRMVMVPGPGTLIASATISGISSTAFQAYSTALVVPDASLVGKPLTITITPGDGTADESLCVDNVRIVESAALLSGDANGDSKVDINDLTITLTNYGTSGMKWEAGEFNGDGRVDINDLTIVLTNYNKTVGAGLAPVPEPGAWWLAAAGAIALLAYTMRKRHASRNRHASK